MIIILQEATELALKLNAETDCPPFNTIRPKRHSFNMNKVRKLYSKNKY